AAPIGRALALRMADLPALRLAFAGRLAAAGARMEALTLLPEGDANFERARADIARGKVTADLKGVMTPRQGLARALMVLASDLSVEASAGSMAVRLVRIALFADPSGVETRL